MIRCHIDNRILAIDRLMPIRIAADILNADVMARQVTETQESSYRGRPCLKVRLTNGARVRHFEIGAVPKAHAWQSWVERDGPPALALFFTLSQALQARSVYEQEIESCLGDGWKIHAEQPS